MLYRMSPRLCLLQAFEAFPDYGVLMVFLSVCFCEVFARDLQLLISVGLSERETVCVRDRERQRETGRESDCHFPLVSMATSTNHTVEFEGFVSSHC